MRLVAGEQDLGVVRLEIGAPVPEWAAGAGWLTLTRTATETSLVCPLAAAPAGAEISGPWRPLTVAGPLSHDMVGVLAALAGPLARAGIPIFVISTFDTDHVLVPTPRLAAALEALAAEGHRIDAGRP